MRPVIATVYQRNEKHRLPLYPFLSHKLIHCILIDKTSRDKQTEKKETEIKRTIFLRTKIKRKTGNERRTIFHWKEKSKIIDVTVYSKLFIKETNVAN